jgi:hypothetical protein
MSDDRTQSDSAPDPSRMAVADELGATRAQLAIATKAAARYRYLWQSARNKELFELALLTVPRLVHAERCGIFVLDEARDNIWLLAGTAMSEGAILVSSADSQVGRAIETGSPQVLTGDAQPAWVDRHMAVHDLVTVPIWNTAHTRAIGALQAVNRDPERACDREDTELLIEIAHWLSGSVELAHSSQEFRTAAADASQTVNAIAARESFLRGDNRLRTFPPAQPIGPDGFLCHRYKGHAYPPFIQRESSEALAHSWHTAANDVILCTHQKVGTHLAKKFLVELARIAQRGMPGSIYEGGDIGHDTVPWPSVLHSQHGAAGFEAHCARTAGQVRLWYEHCTCDALPVQSIHPGTRFVVVVRDPRAAAVSQYFFWLRHPLLGVRPELSLDEFVERFVEGDLYFGDYHSHAVGWVRPADPRVRTEQLLVLTYEDMVLRKPTVARALAQFVFPGHTFTDDELNAICDTTEFGRMKADTTAEPGSFHLNPSVYFRAGKVDDWKQRLSPDAVNVIDAKTRAVWSPSALQGAAFGHVLAAYHDEISEDPT